MANGHTPQQPPYGKGVPLIGQQLSEVPVSISAIPWKLEVNGALKLEKNQNGQTYLPRTGYLDAQTLISMLLNGIREIVREELESMFGGSGYNKLRMHGHFEDENALGEHSE